MMSSLPFSRSSLTLCEERSVLGVEGLKEFDVVVCALGYETRSRYVAENIEFVASTKIALTFDHNLSISRNENERCFDSFGFNKYTLQDNQWKMVFEKMAVKTNEEIRIAVDISSMSKEMMACVLSRIGMVADKRPVKLFSIYAPTSYYELREPYPIQRQGPVSPLLGGGYANPESPLAAIVGLGNERGLAVGAIQAIEPSLLWTYVAIGFDERFGHDVRSANENLSEIYDLTEFTFKIADPTLLRQELQSSVITLRQTHRVMIIPMGSKIFSQMSILTAFFGKCPELTIWQFSSGSNATASDRVAEGSIVTHVATIRRSDF